MSRAVFSNFQLNQKTLINLQMVGFADCAQNESHLKIRLKKQLHLLISMMCVIFVFCTFPARLLRWVYFSHSIYFEHLLKFWMFFAFYNFSSILFTKTKFFTKSIFLNTFLCCVRFHIVFILTKKSNRTKDVKRIYIHNWHLKDWNYTSWSVEFLRNWVRT